MEFLAPIFQLGCCNARAGFTSRISSLEEFPQRTSRGSQNEPVHVFLAVSFKRLKDGAVFAVDRQNVDAVSAGFLLHQSSGHHHRLFVRQRDVFPRAYRGERRYETGATDDRRNHEIA